jgi:hypothetical protein
MIKVAPIVHSNFAKSLSFFALAESRNVERREAANEGMHNAFQALTPLVSRQSAFAEQL